jgi:hypothetical protein
MIADARSPEANLDRLPGAHSSTGQVAVDEVWSALRFRPFKEGEAPMRGGQ